VLPCIIRVHNISFKSKPGDEKMNEELEVLKTVTERLDLNGISYEAVQ